MGDEGIGDRVSGIGDEAIRRGGDKAIRRKARSSGVAAYYQPLHFTLYALHSTLSLYALRSTLQTKAPMDLTDLHGYTEYVEDNTDNK